ncbi:hypothetical protein HP550_19365 [Cellulomonas humilata]|uniref:PemK-like, MazF-like toxin of type II toxin-antitoxin system n=1 Tax=Cellulomonas humilata TaxID=144055 RepID=A0A7Y6A5G6_9CELL|nr:hypothetical protein [Cellulomonas humilata]
MSEIAQLPAEHPWATVGVIAAVLLIGWLLRPRGIRPEHRPRGAAPRPGEVWFAQVPFEDGTGSKDRPVLVLSVLGGSCEVARFTSRDRTGRRDYLPVPQGTPGLPKASWLDRRPITLDRSALRRHVGEPGEAFVAWYRGSAEDLG